MIVITIANILISAIGYALSWRKRYFLDENESEKNVKTTFMVVFLISMLGGCLPPYVDAPDPIGALLIVDFVICLATTAYCIYDIFKD
jgi:hypothetical protein